jgi:hypothetical protein
MLQEYCSGRCHFGLYRSSKNVIFITIQIELRVSRKLFHRVFYEWEETVKLPLCSVEHHAVKCVGEWGVALIISILNMRCSCQFYASVASFSRKELQYH